MPNNVREKCCLFHCSVSATYDDVVLLLEEISIACGACRHSFAPKFSLRRDSMPLHMRACGNNNSTSALRFPADSHCQRWILAGNPGRIVQGGVWSEPYSLSPRP